MKIHKSETVAYIYLTKPDLLWSFLTEMVIKIQGFSDVTIFQVQLLKNQQKNNFSYVLFKIK